MSEASETIKQLNSARDIVLRDAAIYPQVVPGVLPVIGPERPVDLRRWGADFLAETFASPVVSAEEKQKMCLGVLDTLKGYLLRKETMGEEEDWAVVKSAIQCAASIYPLVFRHTVSTPDDAETWAKMASMKSSILRRMDTAPGGVRICCIKFVARVVQVQTPGLIADPRRPEQNEISLALVPRDHKVIPPSNLEAEASGLLDRLLGTLQDNTSDPLIATATLNALASLVQRRASIAAKILATVFSYNPLTLAAGRMQGKDKIAVKSMTRTTMSFLLNVLKRNPSHPLAGRIQQQIERLKQTLIEITSGQNPLKRGAPDEPIDGLSDDKRQKLDRDVDRGATPQQQYPSLPPGPVSLAQLFTLTNDRGAAGFHVEAIPSHIVTQLVPPLLASINQGLFDTAVNAVKSRILEIQRRPPPVAETAVEEDDDYDPSMGFGDGEQIANQLDQLPPIQGQPELAMAPFHLPPPPPLTEQECNMYSEVARDRLFSALHQLEEDSRKTKKATEKERGFNRLATTGQQDREGWIALLTRLATRPTFSLPDSNDEDGNVPVKQEPDDNALVKKQNFNDLPTKLRTAFHTYILDDWRRRLDIAIAWLNEEWYADTLAAKNNPPSNSQRLGYLPNYTPLTLSLLDSLSPYIDTKDTRHLIRFLSEIPHLPDEVWSRVEKLAEDPERVNLASQVLLYLVMFRPPVREAALGAAERIWRENAGAKGVVGKWLGKWKPDVLAAGNMDMKGEGKVEVGKVEARVEA